MSSPRGTGWVTMRRTPERPMDEELRMILETESKTYHTSQNILYVEVRERGEREREREREEGEGEGESITWEVGVMMRGREERDERVTGMPPSMR